MDNKKRVLVVDDDGMIRRLVERVLQREGFVVETARDGVEAIAKLEIGAFDGMVVDLMMPSISGFKLLEILKDDPSISPNWKIVMTAATDQTLEALDRNAIDGLVAKPFDIDELRDMVVACANRRAESGANRSNG